MHPLVSVIVTTKNEENNIENCLKSILEQSYSHIEIIVVDNLSNDNTKKIAMKYTKNVYDIKENIDLSKIKNFRGAQLNFGVEKAAGQIIFFPDADMTFSKELVKEAVRKLDEFDALYVPETICGNGFLGKVRNFERSFYNETPIDGVRFVHKKVFFAVGGFDVKNIVFGPDDWDFTKTLKLNNYKLGITNNMLFHHEGALTVWAYLSKKGKYINTFDGYINKWGKNDPDIKKQFGIWYRFFGVFLEKGKWKKLITHPLLTIGMYFLRGMVGVMFLINKRV